MAGRGLSRASVLHGFARSGSGARGRGGYTPVEAVGSCCSGLPWLLWLRCCPNPDLQAPGRCCFLLQEENRGLGWGHRPGLGRGGAAGWFVPVLEQEGARQLERRGWDHPSPHSVGAFPRGVPGAGQRFSTGSLRCIAAPCSLLRPGMPGRGLPPVPASCSSLAGDFSRITSRFSRFGAALGAGWLIVTSLIVLGREGWCLPSYGWSAAERVG